MVEWHLTSRQAILLLVINWDAHGLLSFLFRDVPGHARSRTLFMRSYLFVHDGFFHDVYGYLFLFQPFLKPIDSIIGKSLAPYPCIYGRILSNKGCGSLCRFSPIDWSCLYRRPCGAACEYALQDWILGAFLLILGKPSVCGSRSGLDPASF